MIIGAVLFLFGIVFVNTTTSVSGGAFAGWCTCLGLLRMAMALDERAKR